jgi:hypothetical protein
LAPGDDPAAPGRRAVPPAYTRAMRRWFCVIVLLFGFAGDGYAWTVRPRLPVPIERSLDPRDVTSGAVPTGAWWLPS